MLHRGKRKSESLILFAATKCFPYIFSSNAVGNRPEILPGNDVYDLRTWFMPSPRTNTSSHSLLQPPAHSYSSQDATYGIR
jgi:hypothetical protein